MLPYRWLLLAVAVAVSCPSWAAQLAVLLRQPVQAALTFDERKVDVRGQLTMDIRIDAQDTRGKATFVGEVRNLALALKGIQSESVVSQPVEGMKSLINIGISVMPGTSVPLRYDQAAKTLEGRMEVLVDLPHTGRFSVDRRADPLSRPVQTGTLQVTLSLSKGLDSLRTGHRKQLSAKIAMELLVREFADPRLRLKPFSGQIIGQPDAQFGRAQSVNTATNAVYNVICLQPISVTSGPNDTDPAGYQEDAQGNTVRDAMQALQGEIAQVWGIANQAFSGLRAEVRPWAFLEDGALKVVADEDVLASSFADSDPDCVEIYFVKRIDDRSMNGAATNGQWAAEAQIIFSDEVLTRGVNGRLAHELGHVIGIPHTDVARRGDGYKGTPNTVACVYAQWDKSHPLRNSAENMSRVSVPPGLQLAPVVEQTRAPRNPSCAGTSDCGACDSN
jgi:hypothetical protein